MAGQPSLHLDGAGLAPGFADPVHGAQRAFRALMTAMAEPGRIAAVGGDIAPPAGVSPAAAAILLTLADFETPLWLPQLHRDGPLARYLRFHCGAPVVDDPGDAVLALIDGSAPAPLLHQFHAGHDAYPDASATVIVEVQAFEGGRPVRLSGPGIESARMISPLGVRSGFWAEAEANHARYPLGVDLMLTSAGEALCLPRSIRIEEV